MKNEVKSMDIDITLADLEDGKSGALGGLLDQIRAMWVGDNAERRTDVRCGTAYILNEEGLGKITIDLRFRLDVERLQRETRQVPM